MVDEVRTVSAGDDKDDITDNYDKKSMVGKQLLEVVKTRYEKPF
jgi:hypothetical protein